MKTVERTENQTLELQVNNFLLCLYEFLSLIHFSVLHLLFTQIQVFSLKKSNKLYTCVVPNKKKTMLWTSSSF